MSIEKRCPECAKLVLTFGTGASACVRCDWNWDEEKEPAYCPEGCLMIADERREPQKTKFTLGKGEYVGKFPKRVDLLVSVKGCMMPRDERQEP